MPKLYGKCFEEQNIRTAIQTVFNDLSIKMFNMSEKQILKEVRMRLRRCTKPNGRIFENQRACIFDRIAQQCIWQVIEPIINKYMSVDSYGFRPNVNEKIPVSKICSKVYNSSNTFVINLDLQQCDILLDDTLDSLRTLGINDGKLISSIKHLMCIEQWSKTFLGQVLINCYLSKLDRWINDNIDKPSKNFSNDFQRHKDDYIEWLTTRGRKTSGKYYRYNDQAIILINTRVEFLDIKKRLDEFLKNFKGIQIKYDYNKFNFLGFRIIKRKEHNKPKIGITPADTKSIYKLIRQTKWNTHKDIWQSLQVIINLLLKYDICNNMVPFLNRLGLRMLKIAKRKNSILKKVPNKVQYTYAYKNQQYIIDIYELRKTIKTSYKEYNLNSSWLILRDNLNQLTEYLHGHQLYKWSLWTRQKGLDIVTKDNLNPKKNHIHHINGNHTDNRLNNLILVNTRTHKLIHNNKETTSVNIQKYRKLL